jgi:hypothetical protein
VGSWDFVITNWLFGGSRSCSFFINQARMSGWKLVEAEVVGAAADNNKDQHAPHSARSGGFFGLGIASIAHRGFCGTVFAGSQSHRAPNSARGPAKTDGKKPHDAHNNRKGADVPADQQTVEYFAFQAVQQM